ncbi:hypothetical protein [Lysobacter tyrosinilyticus]
MISREEYERIIADFIVELNHIILHTGAGHIRALPRFESGMGMYLADLRDPAQEPHQVLYSAFGLVDEFVHADRERILAATFEAHKLGESNRGSS